MDPIFHTDYPLLLALDIVARWGCDGTRHQWNAAECCSRWPASGWQRLRGRQIVGQAALGLTILWGIPVFVNEGARQMADVPMAFFILATGALFYLFAMQEHPGLLVLAGITAGLAAWTKNEGSVLVVGAAAALLLAFGRRLGLRPLWAFVAGLAAPLVVTLYFKFLLAPSGDIVSAAAGGSSGQLVDSSRHILIVQYV
jgi:4-amino-4-deoxy-L-arabinose transferase-like glycosyltransferase